MKKCRFVLLSLFMATVCFAEIDPSDCKFIRGDADCNGVLNISDVTAIASAETSCNDDARDFNNDGQINTTDQVLLAQFLFSGGNPPPAPYPNLGCESWDNDGLEPCCEGDDAGGEQYDAGQSADGVCTGFNLRWPFNDAVPNFPSNGTWLLWNDSGPNPTCVVGTRCTEYQKLEIDINGGKSFNHQRLNDNCQDIDVTVDIDVQFDIQYPCLVSGGCVDGNNEMSADFSDARLALWIQPIGGGAEIELQPITGDSTAAGSARFIYKQDLQDEVCDFVTIDDVTTPTVDESLYNQRPQWMKDLNLVPFLLEVLPSTENARCDEFVFTRAEIQNIKISYHELQNKDVAEFDQVVTAIKLDITNNPK